MREELIRLIISIHALRKESDADARRLRFVLRISIHALRKESDVLLDVRTPEIDISIHALRKESDGGRIEQKYYSYHFNPRSP